MFPSADATADTGRNKELYLLGQYVSYARACQNFGLANDIARRLQSNPDFKAGEHAGDLGGYDTVTGLPCAQIEALLRQVRSYLKDVPDTRRGDAITDISQLPAVDGGRVQVETYNPQLAEIRGPRTKSGEALRIESTPDLVRGARLKALKQYDHYARKWRFDYEAANSHKAISACVVWMFVDGKAQPWLRQAFWQASAEVKDSAVADTMQQCLNWKKDRPSLDCHCQQVKADDVLVLQVPSP